MYNKKAVEKSIREFNEFLENFEEFGFRELTREELYKVNGGGEAEPDDTENSSENENDSGGFSGSETFSETEATSGTEPASSITETEAENNSSSHTVESDDTLSEIVADYNEQNGTSYTYQEIAEQNGIENPDMIHPGDVIEFGNNAEKSDITDAGQNQESPKTEGNGNEENSSFNDDFWSETDSSDDSGDKGNFGGTTAKDEQGEKSGNVYDNVVIEEEKNGKTNQTSKSANDLPMTATEIAIKAETSKESYKISVFKESKSSSNREKEVLTYGGSRFLESTEKTIGTFGNVAYFMAKATENVKAVEKLSSATLKFSNELGYASTFIDGYQFVTNPTFKNCRDFAVSVIGSRNPVLGLFLQGYYSIVDTIFSEPNNNNFYINSSPIFFPEDYKKW